MPPPPCLQVWRAWIKEGSRKQRAPGGSVAEAPPPLAQALQGTMCECHGRLLNYEVPSVIHRWAPQGGHPLVTLPIKLQHHACLPQAMK